MYKRQTHCWGKAPFESGDSSKNNAWVAALTFGEGWHNNHHAFPNSAKQGLFKGQIDITWEHIKIHAKIALAKKVKLHSRTYYKIYCLIFSWLKEYKSH